MSESRRRSLLAKPLKPASNSTDVTPLRRLDGSFSQDSFNGPVDVEENDDEAERKERKRQRLLERHLASPSTPEGRKSVGSSVAGLTATQLAEHYSNCIKLSAENKINIKNAFNLQLIDCMAVMLRKKDSNLNNFQVASCTLDASTKIYAYRVDSVYNDTVKMAGGLGHATQPDGKKQDADDVDQGGGMDVDGVEVVTKKKKRRAATVHQNPENLNLKDSEAMAQEVDLEVEMQFRRMATLFGDGRSGGPRLMSTMAFRDDGAELLMPWSSAPAICDPRPVEDVFGAVQIIIPDIQHLELDPTFGSFICSGWSVENDDVESRSSFSAEKMAPADPEHVFDINAIPNDMDGASDDGADNIFNSLDDVAPDDEDPGGDAQSTSDVLPELELLRSHLAAAPTSFGHLDTRLITAWAGPAHWKIKNIPKEKRPSSESRPPLKSKKEDLVLDYDGANWQSLVQRSRPTERSTTLSSLTMRQWNREKTTLPLDAHCKPVLLTCLFLRNRLTVKKHESAEVVPEVEDEFNYDNEFDHETFCPNVENMDDSRSVGDGGDGGEYSQSAVESQGAGCYAESLGGGLEDTLIPPPNKVAKILIPYARTAKKVDMRRMKEVMWEILSGHTKQKSTETPSASPPERMTTEMKFSEVYKGLEPLLPPLTAKNLSAPLAFVALLHLCNERCLELAGLSDFSDFNIQQG